MNKKSRIGTTLAVLPLAAAFGLFGCEGAEDSSDPSSSSSALGAGARGDVYCFWKLARC